MFCVYTLTHFCRFLGLEEIFQIFFSDYWTRSLIVYYMRLDYYQKNDFPNVCGDLHCNSYNAGHETRNSLYLT